MCYFSRRRFILLYLRFSYAKARFMNKKFLAITITLFAVFGLLFAGGVKAGSEHNVSGWAWSENIGWISFNNTTGGGGINYGVNIDSDGTFSGYAWSENIGWIDFAPSGSYPDVPDYSVKVDTDSSEVSGWARALSYGDGWEGWIKMRDTDYGVSINFSNDEFSGYAWSDMVIGWISFNCANEGVCEESDYKVITSFAPPPIISNFDNSFTPCSQSRIPTFSWWVDDTQEPEEPYYYEIQLCGNSDCSGPADPLVSYSTEDPTYSTSWAPSLPCLYCCDEEPYNNIEFGGTTYYGQVRASYTGDEWSGWTSDSSFVTYDHCWPYADFLCDGEDCEEMEIYEEVVVDLANSSTLYVEGEPSCFWVLPDIAQLLEGYTTSDCELEVTFSAPAPGQRDQDITLTVTDSSSYSCSATKTVEIRFPLPEYKEVSPIIWLKNFFAKVVNIFAGF